MMQTAQPTQVPPELGALLTLVQGMQQGNVAPTTPEGQPTVAAQAAQAAAQRQAPPQGGPQMPGIPQVAQQAAMGNQQQMQAEQEKMQQLPKQMEQLAQRQQAMEQGLASAPGAGAVRMAGGGIVGFSGGGFSDIAEGVAGQMGDASVPLPPQVPQVQQPQKPSPALLEIFKWAASGRNPRELQRVTQLLQTLPPNEQAEAVKLIENSAQPPRQVAPPVRPQVPPVRPPTAQAAAAPPRPGIAGTPAAAAAAAGNPALASAADAMYKRAEDTAKGMAYTPPTQQDILAGTDQQRQTDEEIMRRNGIDPKQPDIDIAAAQAREKEKMAYIQQREAEFAKRSKYAELMDFMRGARGYKGFGIGQVFRTGSEAAEAGEAGRRQEGAALMELRLAYQEASAKEQQALRALKLATAMNQRDRAQAATNAVQAARMEMSKILAKMQGDEAGSMRQSADKAAENASRERMSTADNASRERAAGITAGGGADGRTAKERAADARFLQMLNSSPDLKALAKQLEYNMPGAQERYDAAYAKILKQHQKEMGGPAAPTPTGGNKTNDPLGLR